MAVAVDPFSFATAELSEEYIGVFPHPDIVPKYLETVSDKTGVQLLTGFDTISIKGSWVEIKRARSFLAEFLTSYQTAQLSQDIELFGETETDNPCDEDELSPVENSDTKFRESTGELSDWLKWTAEVLPQIQKTRSKRASVYSEPKTQAKKVPEPLVLYANYQPTPNPAARKPPTLDAIEKELKKVYDKEKIVASDLLNAFVDTQTTADSNRVSDKQPEVGAGDNIPEAHSDTCTSPSGFDELQENVSTEVNASVHDENITTVCSPAVAGSETVTSTHETTAETEQVFTPVLSTSKELPPSKPDNFGQHKTNALDPEVSEFPDATVETDGKGSNKKSKSRSRKKFTGIRKLVEIVPSHVETEIETPVIQTDLDTQTESQMLARPADLSDHKQTLETSEKTKSSTREAQPQRKTRRKGQPKKIEKYNNKKKKEEDIPEVPITIPLSRTQRASTRRKKKDIKKIEKTPTKPRSEKVKKKRGRQDVVKAEPVDAKEEDKDLACDLCSYVAKKLTHLREHKRRVHITKEFKCDTCGRVFGFRKDLKRHYSTHEKAENCCDICGKMYKGVRTLAEHKKTHETGYMKPEFPCEFCKKVFSTKYVLAYHIKSDHLGIKKTYICPTCGKSFSQKNSYLQHANVHVGIKPYQCDTCGRSFSYEKSLKEHKYTHEDDKQFECPKCHKKFRQSTGVAIHMKIHKERKDYVCSACGKGFSQKQALIRHERIHLGEKPFSCALCHRKFTDSSILRRHMILIHKKDPKKWREDTENNVQRRTDFFIGVVGEDGKVKKREGRSAVQNVSESDVVESENTAVPDMAGEDGEEAGVDGDGDHCQSESADNSFSFIPVGIGSIPVSHSHGHNTHSVDQPQILTVLPQHPPVSNAQDVKLSNMASEAGAMATLTIDNHGVSAVNKVDTSDTDDAFAMALGPSLSKNSTHPPDLSSPSHSQAQLHAQAAALLNSYTYSDPHRLPSTDFYSSDLQQGLQLPQYSSVLSQGAVGYHHPLVMMADSLNFHTESMNVTTASQQVQQASDYDSLISQSHSAMQQEQYSNSQQQS